MVKNTEEALKQTRIVIDDIRSIVSGIKTVDRKEELETKPKAFQDKYVTKEQNSRDEEITKLLQAYVTNYVKKVESNQEYKDTIFNFSMLVLMTFSLALVVIFIGIGVQYGKKNENDIYILNDEQMVEEVASKESDGSMEQLVSLITVCVSYLTLVFGILTIITKYAFPEKEEEYMKDIVMLIQNNDLRNKQENMKTAGYESLNP